MQSMDPLKTFDEWYADAVRRGIPMADAMALATIGDYSQPAVRYVLYKGTSRGGIRFFTHLESPKGRDLRARPRAACAFFWHNGREPDRQVRLEGLVERLSGAEVLEYFHTRPRESQIGAWASPQSTEIESREWLEARVEDYGREYPGEVPLPPHWGGFRLVPETIEFWTAGAGRLHDRKLFTKQLNGSWKESRLAP